jgi:hypothetical protein
MRARFLIVALTSIVSALAIASCSEGGTGVGTAPPPAKPCPAAAPAAGSPCQALQVCPYPPCTSGTCVSTQTVAYCPGGAGATWQISVAGDGGGFSDAEIPEISIDSGNDGAEAGDAGDAEPDVADAPEG